MKYIKVIVALFASFAVNKIFILIILFLISYKVFCQNDELSEIITEIAEQLAADESDPDAAEMFIEQLHELSENPVNINSGAESEISRLFFLSDFQIRSIIDHIKRSGAIVSVYEIASIPGFDRQATEIMMPFISLKYNDNDLPKKLYPKNTLITNYIIKPGESDTSSSGPLWKTLLKYKVTARSFSGGLTVEKDAGEKFFSGSPPLPDFLSSYFSWAGKGMIRQLILGDYSARFGQGTHINTRMRTGLSLTSAGYMTGRDEIRPYTSSDENNFFRGVAAEFSIKNLGVSLFLSRNKIDATVSSSADSAGLYVSNLYKAGLHNTVSLIQKKDAVSETFYGININYNIPSVRFGLTWSESRFSLPVNLTSGPEDLYGFEGKTNRVFSAYYKSLIKRILLFGEVSADDSQDFAMVQGVALRPSDRLSINFLYRNYAPGFAAFHSRGPGSSSSTGNEYGLLGNFTFEAAKHLFISAGCDIARFPWLKYRTSYPSMARKQEIKLKYIPAESISIEASYNYRYSMCDENDEPGIPGIEELTVRTLRTIVRYSPAGNLALTTRIDYKTADESGSKGMLMLQDLKYRFRQAPVTIWLRYCIFSTDDWNSRLYAYENDLLYSFSIPALSGKGSRTYLMAQWEIADIAELRIKYGLTTLCEDGTSPVEKDELRMQFRIWF